MLDSSDNERAVSVGLELELLSDDEWEDLQLRLRFYAFKHYSHLIKYGVDLKDIVVDSMIAAQSGERVRPPNEPLFNFICGIIKSNVSHYCEKISRRNKLNSNEQATQGLGQQNSFEDEQKRIELSSLMTKIRKLIKGDKLLNTIHQAITTDPEIKPAEIAAENNLTVDEVKNARKRYVRLFKKLWSA